jgi:hypothetical protein
MWRVVKSAVREVHLLGINLEKYITPDILMSYLVPKTT